MRNKKEENLKRIYIKKQIIIILFLLLFCLSFVPTFARYVTNSINNFFVRSEKFYFNSDKLSEDKDIFQIENWSGIDDYTIIVNMNSRKNNLEAADFDIGYDISYTCSNNAICQLNKTSGIISKETNTDFFYLTITPNTLLETGDKVVVNIKATSNTNYVKTIEGRFTLVVGKEDLTYQITDKEDNPYMDLRITNTVSYYRVKEAFGDYIVNQKIDIDTYLGLSEENKNKCYSSIVTIEFDPEKILIDNTSKVFSDITNVTTEEIAGKSYINSITLPIEPISSVDIRFYKIDKTQDYTYSNLNNNSVVEVTTI